MRAHTYNTVMRDFAEMADAMNRAWGWGVTPYDYGRNGGSNGQNNGHQYQQAEAGSAQRVAHLPVNAWADDDNFFIQAYLPGVTPDAVEITFDKEELTIRGEFPAASGDVQFIKRELFSGPFERRLTFRTPVDVDNIEAFFENGMLTLTVPKAAAAKPRQIKVQAK